MEFEYTDKVVEGIPSNQKPYAEFVMGVHTPHHWAVKIAMGNPGVVFEAKGTENGYTYLCQYVYYKCIDTFYQYGSGLGVRCPGFAYHHVGKTCSACRQKD